METTSPDDPLPTTELPFLRLQEAVLEPRPVLRELMRKHGQKSLLDYAMLYTDVNLNPPIQRRQDELIGTIRTEVARHFNDETAQAVAQQLERYYFVSTSDHHGPIVDPSFSNANLLAAVSHSAHNDPYLKFNIVLACSSISFRNISFPRGLLFHRLEGNAAVVEKLSFFPASARSCPVFNFRGYTAEEIKGVQQTVAKQVQKKLYAKSIGDKLTQLLEEVYLDPKVLACKTFSDQVTLTNAELWKRFFPNQVAPSQLLSLEQEAIVTQLLLNYHLDQDTILNHVLFDPKYEAFLEQYFDGIMGAFSTKEKYGSYLFWALPPGSKYRMQVWKQGQALVTEDGSYRVELTPAAIREALSKRELFPTTMLDFFVLSFYYGLKCLGGFNQINYLTSMKNAYIKLNVDRGNYRSIEVCARSQTKEMSDGYLIAYGETPDHHLVPVNGIDLYLYGNDQSWEIIRAQAKQLTIAESLAPAMPEFYQYVYTEEQRLPELSAITPEAIVRSLGIDKKLHPCFQF